ncbi:MAG TPA: ABC transporter permease subunit [Roseiflexaceae bacterium]|nr:ABC transporter permease subunit [Roseiflexaceae bacterium]
MKTARTLTAARPVAQRIGFWQAVVKDFRRNKYIYLMLLPVLAYYIIFHYIPMYGAQIAFRDFVPARGIWGSEWIGFEHFEDFFKGIFFWRLMRNTLAINILDVLFGFPAPIVLALLLNELTSDRFKRVVQTITYMPHFISLVVVVGMLIDFLARDGLINNMLAWFGVTPTAYLQRPDLYWFIYVGSGIWQSIGWGSIIYLAAITTIDPTLYEAAKVDGASRLRQIWHITLPGIRPTIILLLILRIGMLMNVGYEKTILLYNPLTYQTADVISTYVYRKGILDANFGFSSAVGLFNSAINFVLLIIANRVSRRLSESGLW